MGRLRRPTPMAPPAPTPRRMLVLAGLAILPPLPRGQEVVPAPPPPQEEYRPELLTDERRVIVTNQAMGARCAVAADFDGDGLLDLVAASSNDNAVSWFRNEGVGEDGLPVFSIKKQITWSSLGSRIVTVADIDSDGDVDVIGASYYDSSLRWFENDGTGVFTPHVISTAVNEGQGVTVADVDNDGTVDVISASSGDNTIAVFRNLDGNGTFCEIKEIVDDDAVGARTAVAADLNGDGWVDIASASKDDDTVAWYPNDGTGRFPTKLIVSSGELSKGAYSLVARDVDGDGTQDLVVASNGNDAVTLWRNDGKGNFTPTLIYDQADFVLSVTAVDFDRDGDIDVASASFFDGRIIWYENLDGKGYNWTNHTVYVGLQGHYVSHADMDGDGDDDLIAVTHAENTVAVYFARTGCDSTDSDNATASDGKARRPECCRRGTEWNDATLACEPCPLGEYGAGGIGADAACAACPMEACTIPEFNVMPATCSGVTGCADVATGVAQCSCPPDTVRDDATDACTACPEGQIRPDTGTRTADTLGNYSAWEERQGTCEIYREEGGANNAVLIGVIVALVVVVMAAIAVVVYFKKKGKREDDVWMVRPSELKFSDPPEILGRGTFGLVVLGEYRGTEVAVKRVIPPKVKGGVTDSMFVKHPSMMFRMPRRSTNGTGSGPPQVLRRISSGGEGGEEDDESTTEEVTHVVTHRRKSSMGSFDKRSSFNSDIEDQPSPDLEAAVADSGNQTVLLTTTHRTSKNGLDQFCTALASNPANKACDVATHEMLVKDFLKEMRHLSKLRHPCITTVMGAVIQADAEPALVMEYMDRGSLYDILHNETVALDGDVLLPILQDICQGLRFLHCADPPVVHGDLKSANVLVDSKSRAKIADFGLTQKQEIGVAGTPYWMSPELLRGDSGNTTASDVYSFGIILYEVYSRKDPYEDEEGSFRSILAAICDKNINKRPPVPSACPDTIGVLMRECLDGDPTARPSSEELDLRLKRERVANVEPGDMHLTVQHKKMDEKSRGASLIYEMFPEHIADALQAGEKIEPEHHDCVSVFFSDVVNFTTISHKLGHKKCARMLDQLYTKFDELSHKHAAFKIDVIGDAYLGVTNLVKDQKDDHARRLAEFAIDAVKAAGEVPLDEDDPSKGNVQIRVGLHSGPVIADVLGTRLPKYSIFGDTVNTASRMESNSEAGRIHCSSATASLLSKQAPSISRVSRGIINIKGKGEMHTFWIDEEAPETNGVHEAGDGQESSDGKEGLVNFRHSYTEGVKVKSKRQEANGL